MRDSLKTRHDIQSYIIIGPNGPTEAGPNKPLFLKKLSFNEARYALRIFTARVELFDKCLAGAVAIAIGSFLSPSLVGAQAIRFQSQGVATAGQGNAFAAQADDPSAIHYNPAALSRLHGVQASFGISLMGGSIRATNQSAGGTHGDFGGALVFPPPGHTYVTANLGALGASRFSAITIGVGLNTPFGLKTRYPENGHFNTAATSAALPLLAIKPTIAYRVTEDLSVGVSADIYTFASFLGEGHAEQRQVSAGGLGIPAGATSLRRTVVVESQI